MTDAQVLGAAFLRLQLSEQGCRTERQERGTFLTEFSPTTLNKAVCRKRQEHGRFFNGISPATLFKAVCRKRQEHSRFFNGISPATKNKDAAQSDKNLPCEGSLLKARKSDT